MCALGMLIVAVVALGLGVYFAPKLGWVQRKVDEIRQKLQ